MNQETPANFGTVSVLCKPLLPIQPL